jgi:hypothetical protein
VDMHATHFIGINGITRVLLVYTCQQGVHPRGHVLTRRLPGGEHGDDKFLLMMEAVRTPETSVYLHEHCNVSQKALSSELPFHSLV